MSSRFWRPLWGQSRSSLEYFWDIISLVAPVPNVSHGLRLMTLKVCPFCGVGGRYLNSVRRWLSLGIFLDAISDARLGHAALLLGRARPLQTNVHSSGCSTTISNCHCPDLSLTKPLCPRSQTSWTICVEELKRWKWSSIFEHNMKSDFVTRLKHYSNLFEDFLCKVNETLPHSFWHCWCSQRSLLSTFLMGQCYWY